MDELAPVAVAQPGKVVAEPLPCRVCGVLLLRVAYIYDGTPEYVEVQPAEDGVAHFSRDRLRFAILRAGSVGKVETLHRIHHHK